VRTLFVPFALAVAVAASLADCGGPVGSCLFTTDAGYDYCEDFLGTEYNSSAAQNSCETGNGVYSSSDCTTAGALGTCLVGSGTADDFRYTYTPDGANSDAALEVESACGLAGGTFTAG
jgi:hypothetical protein